MSLLDINPQPTYTLMLPASKQKVKFRPFLEMERKILLMALESGEETDVINAVKKIIKNCCETPIDVNKLTLIDIEKFFLALRAKSIGEIVTLIFRCENVVDEQTEKHCKNKMEIKVNLDEVEIFNLKDNMIVDLSSNLKVEMIYPPIIEIKHPADSIEYVHTLIANSIGKIFYGEDVYTNEEHSLQDFLYFVERLTPAQFKKLEDFVSDQPILRKIIDLKCSKCGFDHTIPLEGLQSFFV